MKKITSQNFLAATERPQDGKKNTHWIYFPVGIVNSIFKKLVGNQTNFGATNWS